MGVPCHLNMEAKQSAVLMKEVTPLCLFVLKYHSIVSDLAIPDKSHFQMTDCFLSNAEFFTFKMFV